MFEQNGRYRHKSTLDVDIFVFDVVQKTETGTVLRVAYYHRHSNFFFADPKNRRMVYTEKVTVKDSALPLWERINEPSAA